MNHNDFINKYSFFLNVQRQIKRKSIMYHTGLTPCESTHVSVAHINIYYSIYFKNVSVIN